MKQEIIEQMRQHLYDNRWCKSDFEKYDAVSLQLSNEPFFWLVRESGTVLMYIGTSTINKWFEDECLRMQIFQCPTAPIGSIEYYATHYRNQIKCFYWDGYSLQQIQVSEVESIYNNLTGDTLASMMEKYADEVAICHEPLEIRFAAPETQRRYNESVEYAKSLNDTSLTDCVNRLSKYQRLAVNHYIQISSDFTKHGYCFAEMINDKPRLCGGIIMDPDATSNRWSTHT